jgi:hypothetical protein
LAAACSATAVAASLAAPSGPAVAATPRTIVQGGAQPTPNAGPSNSRATKKGPYISPNWAGFAVTGSPVTGVAGSWTQPSAVCPGTKAEQSAFWVGIDGFSKLDPTVEQVGTDADCTKGTKKHPGGPAYYAWYEMYPLPLFELSPGTYVVEPGDVLSASVQVSGLSYVLTISSSRGWSYSTTQPGGTPAPLDESAEWIAEDPSTCTATKCTTVPMADFGSVNFSGATVDGSLPVNSTSLSDTLITMAKNKKPTGVKASTTALGAGGNSFTITWVAI